MTHSGKEFHATKVAVNTVLIPLLLDDPLWAHKIVELNGALPVLIPLLLDDPLWDTLEELKRAIVEGLNPSFAVWPTLGVTPNLVFKQLKVLIALLVDDPLRDGNAGLNGGF